MGTHRPLPREDISSRGRVIPGKTYSVAHGDSLSCLFTFFSWDSSWNLIATEKSVTNYNLPLKGPRKQCFHVLSFIPFNDFALRCILYVLYSEVWFTI